MWTSGIHFKDMKRLKLELKEVSFMFFFIIYWLNQQNLIESSLEGGYLPARYKFISKLLEKQNLG